MEAFDTTLNRRPRAVGVKLAVIALVLLVVVAAWGLAYWWAKSSGHLKPVERAVGHTDAVWPSWMGKGARKATYVETPVEGNHRPVVDPRDEQLRRLQRELEDQRRLMEQLRQQKAAPSTAKAPPAAAPPSIKRPPMFFVTTERKADALGAHPTYALAAGTWIPCTLETALNSEIEGYFTVKTRRSVMDTETGQHILIPQGLSIVAKAATSALLLGNERIPTFALTLSLPSGAEVELGEAPIVDATGTNGLTGEVNNHIWRLVWTSVFIGGLRGGQQVLQTQLGQEGAGSMASGIGSQASQVTQQRLGRAQDTRPTLTVEPGQACNVLLVTRVQLPEVSMARR